MDEPIPVAGHPVPERLIYKGNGKFSLDGGNIYFDDSNRLYRWFVIRDHHASILPDLLIFRAVGQPHYPAHTAFAGETVVWDPARKHLYVETTLYIESIPE